MVAFLKDILQEINTLELIPELQKCLTYSELLVQVIFVFE